jgi:acyl-CoA thioester hydrolase
MVDENLTDPLSKYPDIVSVDVQWGDQDAFGHVNNTVYLRWFEIGRISYVAKLGLSHDKTKPTPAPILAAVTCNFLRQVTFPDRVQVATRVVRVGNRSLAMEHVVLSETHRVLVAEGTSTVVNFDYRAGQSCPLSDELRAKIAEVEATRSL